jgi:hypothetical protein
VKRISIEEIRRLLGEKTIERLEIATLREKARRIRAITPSQVCYAQKLIKDGLKNRQSIASFNAVSRKWIVENPRAKKAFLMYSTKLLTKAKKK